MPEGVEDRNGRALEYAFVEGFIRAFPNGVLQDHGRLAAIRSKWDLCDLDLRKRFFKAANAYYGWVKLNLNAAAGEAVASLHLYSDQEGQAFGVRDFTLKVGSLTQNVSLKHNHYALKHPRIPSFLQSLGVQKGLLEDNQYRLQYGALLDSIWHEIETQVGPLGSFEAMGPLKADILYRKVMTFLVETLARFADKPNAVQSLYAFLTGGDHIKLVVRSNAVEVYDLQLLSRPHSLAVTTDIERPGYFFVTFDNGFSVHYRVKNDSKRLNKASPALKLDVQPESNLPIIATLPC